MEFVRSSVVLDSVFASTCFGEVDGEAADGDGGDEASSTAAAGADDIPPSSVLSFFGDAGLKFPRHLVIQNGHAYRPTIYNQRL